MSRRRALCLPAFAFLCGLLGSCESGGHFTLLGYTTKPNFDCSIRTVRVPIFQNRTMGAFRQGLEFDLTQAIVREIERRTPYKVVSGPNADTEITGTIKGVTKNILNVTQLNEIRQGETVLAVEVVWRDLRTGKILSRPARRPGEPLPIEALADPALNQNGLVPNMPATVGPPAFPNSPEVPVEGGVEGQPLGPAIVSPDVVPAPKGPGPLLLTSRGTFIPELGQSITSSLQTSVDRMAVQIVNMMELPW